MPSFLRRITGVINDKLGRYNTPYQKILDVADERSEIERVRHFQRLYDYYIGDEKEILRHLEEAMGRTFKTSTIDRMQLPYMNIVRRVIDRLALAYKLSPDRYVVVEHKSEGEQTIPDEKQQKSQDNYQEMLKGSNINAQAKLWHKLAKLSDTVLVQPAWRDEHLEYDVFAPHQIYVRERQDNFLLAEAVVYQITQRNEAGESEFRKVFWSDTQHYILDKDDKPIPQPENPDNINPYGVLPFAILRMKETENFWGEGDTQLVNICEKTNILLASAYHNVIMQSHGQAIAINFNVKGELQTGPDTVIQADNVSTDMQTPQFQFAHPEPAINESMQFIDWIIKTAGMMRGLAANSLSIEAKAESGAAKAIDNFELMELREDDLEILRPFEKQLFNISRTVWNYHSSGEQKIAEDAVFGIDFIEPEIMLTPKEEYEVKQIKLKLGLWTPDDDIIDEDEGIDQDTARALVREKLEFRNELNDQYGILSNLKLLEEPQQSNDETTKDKFGWAEGDLEKVE